MCWKEYSRDKMGIQSTGTGCIDLRDVASLGKPSNFRLAQISIGESSGKKCMFSVEYGVMLECAGLSLIMLSLLNLDGNVFILVRI